MALIFVIAPPSAARADSLCDNSVAVPNPSANSALIADCNTLLSVKETLAGTATLNWSENTAITSWEGITVGGSPRRVTRIELASRDLTGTIPAELGNLTKLTRLHLNNNELTGPIPPGLGNLTKLIELRLQSNELTGPIPAELGALTGLTRLYLYGNELTGPIPSELGALTDLIDLRLYDNELTGPIPPGLGNLTGLTFLYLYDNELTGPIPPGLGNLTGLTLLYLNNNEFTGPIPPELGNLTKLTRLHLNNNELTGPIPPGLGNLTKLTHLYLYDNELTGPIPPELGNLTKLTHLYLYGNELTGPIPPELGNLTKLTRLYLYGNELTGPIPPELGNLTKLRLLNLSSNKLSGLIPAQFGSLIKLSVLSLNCNILSGTVPPELGNAGALTTLNIGGNRFTEPLPALDGVEVTATDDMCGSAFNASPIFNESDPATRTAVEDWGSNRGIGNPIEATDADNDSLTYSLSGNDAASFGIDSSTGQLKTKASLDRATKDSYMVTVKAEDAYGGSTTITVAIEVIALPSQPIIGTITTGDGELTVPWSEISRDGGSETIAYDLQYRPSGAEEWTLVDNAWARGASLSPLSYTIRSLTNGAAYEVQVRAVNGVGEGPWSYTETAMPAAVPEPTPTSIPEPTTEPTATDGLVPTQAPTVAPTPSVKPTAPGRDEESVQLSALAVALVGIGGLAIGAIAGATVVAGVQRKWGWTRFIWGPNSPRDDRPGE